MVNLAVDSDADRVELRGNRRKSFDEAAQQLVDAWRIDGNLGHATGRGGPAAGQVDRCHDQGSGRRASSSRQPFALGPYPSALRQSPAAINPARTRGGDSGSSVKRTPVASRIALATVASGGTIGTSPTPR